MPPLAIAAGIGAVGSIAGSAIQSSAAKKACKDAGRCRRFGGSATTAKPDL